MFSSLDQDGLLTGLGDKFLAALVSAVSGTRADIDDMRAWRPGWFPSMHPRVLADLIHDRIWVRLTATLDGDDTITIVENGPTREIQVGTHLLLRVKRHHQGNRISTYPTQTALDFYIQQPTLPGLELITLAAGYIWEPELRKIGGPVVSCRDGKDNPIWAVGLEESRDGTTEITWTPILGPSLPEVGYGDSADSEKTGNEDES